MRLANTTYYACGFLCVCCLLSSSAVFSQNIPQDRPYEPIVVTVQSTPLPQDDSAPIGEYCLFNYDAILGTWRAIPFQIDEVDASGSYFQGQDGLLDGLDQIVFASRDILDQAPINDWVANPEARQNPRYEFRVTDPLNPGSDGYVYLYRSTTFDKSGIPNYMQYLAGPSNSPAADSVSGLSYLQGHTTKHGLPNYLTITDAATNAPFIGNTAAINTFDRLKVRISGSFLFGSITFTEDTLNAQPPQKIEGPVRILREVRNVINALGQTITLDVLIKFYPYSAELSGEIPVPSIPFVSFKLFRFSFDLNSNANGYSFYNHANSLKIIDATPDVIVDDVLIGNNFNWDISAGAHGKIVKLIQLDVSALTGVVPKYYYFDKTSGTGDGTPDTGDGLSYGDSGVRFDGSNIGGTLLLFIRNYYLSANTTIAGLSATPADSALGALLAAQATMPLTINTINPQQFDLIPPARISDLGVVDKTTNSMILVWTAPGDDSTSGKASQYTLYFDTTPVGADTAAWIQNATVDNNLPAPGDPNTMEQYTVGDLMSLQPYFFILVASDEFGNQGGFSNVATEITVPIELAAFAATATGNAVYLSWHTASETNNAGFAIERQAEKDENGWVEIAFLAADGTSTEPQAYSFVDKVTEPGNYFYRLRQVDFDGSFLFSHEIRVQVLQPEQITLAQNYPNPFKLGGQSIIHYTLPERSDHFVSVKVYNLIGQEIGILFSGQQKPGYHQISWDGRFSDGRQVTVGVYFLVLEAAGKRVIRKIAILP